MRRWMVPAAIALMLAACGSDKKEAAAPGPATVSGPAGEISGTLTVDPALAAKLGPAPLLMIIASTSSDPSKPPIIVKRVADATFPYEYKLTAEDITLVGSTFGGKVYVSARIDPAGRVGPPGPGVLEGVYRGNPVPVGSAKIDITINKEH